MASNPSRNYWFVGTYVGQDDMTATFVSEGYWENGYGYIDLVKSIQPGDRIALKTTYIKKRNLPFDNRGHRVSTMDIKAIGTVLHNPGDGRTLKVDWELLEPAREWYFYTYVRGVWRVIREGWMTDGLIQYAFEGVPQDINRFTNHPYWRERYSPQTEQQRFSWTRFYESFADKLLEYKNKRDALISGIHELSSQIEGIGNLHDTYSDGSTSPLQDICPFTVMAIFNRWLTDDNRKKIAMHLAELLGVAEPVPDSLEGVPVVHNQRSWFFGYSRYRRSEDIDTLWEIFEAAIRFADSGDARKEFIEAYDKATHVYGIGWNLTIGLFWIRPWTFATLDSKSQNYLNKQLDVQIGQNGPDKRCNAKDYLNVIDELETRFKEDAYPVHSFPGLSLAAWLYKGDLAPTESEADSLLADDVLDGYGEGFPVAPIDQYSIEHIIAEGCFYPREKLEEMLESLRVKRNLILQGPPGTGKSWLAKRLGYALMGERNGNKMRAVQFHPNLSYEDFVRGWRPDEEGRLNLVDGPFMEMVLLAKKEHSNTHVLVIEEINRGNPAQIFGEMLTLLEADKRTPSAALELSYRAYEGERVFIPANLYIIGTMNIADRSLALVDYALRRRFRFIDLEPILGNSWRDWVHEQFHIPLEVLTDIQRRMMGLNEEISADTSLGPQFRIGHSYVTPPVGDVVLDAKAWFRQIVTTEIGPLLDEYWYDSLEKARAAKARLLDEF